MAQVFVACLGASNYTYAEASWTQQSRDWIQSHIHALEYFQGVPEVIIPDNLKSGVSRSCRYDPDINRSYQRMAEHYQTAILPARAYKPKDKAKVENGVLVVGRWILATLRNRTFFSLAELNTAIQILLKKLNQRAFRKLPGCRLSLYQEVDLPVLKPLPEKRYEYEEWKNATVHIDYHVEADHHYYSVPYDLLQKRVEIRMTDQVVEIFHQGTRITSHIRSYKRGGFTTQDSHRPQKHKAYLQWNPERIVRWAEKIGTFCKMMVQEIMSQKKYPEQGYRACLGILRLSKSYSELRLEKACQRACQHHLFSYRNVELILKNRMESMESEPSVSTTSIRHENIRGTSYYEIKENVSCY